MNTRVKLALGVAVAGALAVAGSAAVAGGGSTQVSGTLTGYEEVPAVSTAANGRLRATVTPSDTGFAYRLSYAGLEGSVTQAHIHFAQAGVNGGISVWLCGTGTNPGPAGTPVCPAPSGSVEGTIDAADVVGPAAQGIAPGEFGELLRAMRAGVTYANVHSSMFPGGEIRSQLRANSRRDDD